MFDFIIPLSLRTFSGHLPLLLSLFCVPISGRANGFPDWDLRPGERAVKLGIGETPAFVVVVPVLKLDENSVLLALWVLSALLVLPVVLFLSIKTLSNGAGKVPAGWAFTALILSFHGCT
ncbi:hypothetical protein LSM04_004948 [Trypanosoma melophagium]|uniref:uncharacterized protein n=1 Tax=Trypanosoma melophagium TaxID=715481 RepID=UPI00351A62CD|nr:hypothetical protein LSM04_004948 [Trypanosoma melophagium]